MPQCGLGTEVKVKVLIHLKIFTHFFFHPGLKYKRECEAQWKKKKKLLGNNLLHLIYK